MPAAAMAARFCAGIPISEDVGVHAADAAARADAELEGLYRLAAARPGIFPVGSRAADFVNARPRRHRRDIRRTACARPAEFMLTRVLLPVESLMLALPALALPGHRKRCSAGHTQAADHDPVRRGAANTPSAPSGWGQAHGDLLAGAGSHRCPSSSAPAGFSAAADDAPVLTPVLRRDADAAELCLHDTSMMLF